MNASVPKQTPFEDSPHKGDQWAEKRWLMCKICNPPVIEAPEMPKGQRYLTRQAAQLLDQFNTGKIKQQLLDTQRAAIYRATQDSKGGKLPPFT